MKLYYFIFLLVCSVFGYTQEITLLTNLADELSENSGVIWMDNTLILHNDSGGEASLYVVNPQDGSVTRKVDVTNAVNIDWEDITIDDEYLYIGDFGNNSGSRRDLKIYIVSLSDFRNTTTNEVEAITINFEYEDQVDFTPANLNTNFDAETLVSFQDQLYVFTKNWVDNRTNVYRIPKTPGTYTANKVGTFDVEGLITGGTYSNDIEAFVLVGYSGLQAFVVTVSNAIDDFMNPILQKEWLTIPSLYSTQTEGITWMNTNRYFITAEKDPLTRTQALYEFTASPTLQTSEVDFEQQQKIDVYITKDNLTLTNVLLKEIRLYTLQGTIIRSSSSSKMRIADIPKGIYMIAVALPNGTEIIKKICICSF